MQYSDTHETFILPAQQSSLRETFGEETLAFLLEMSVTGDPLADAAIDALATVDGEHKRSLEKGIRESVGSVPEAPDAVKRLLEQSERSFDGADVAALDRGAGTYLAVGPYWIGASLGPASLAHSFSSPAGAKVLASTGNLDRNMDRRWAETGRWNAEITKPGAQRPGASGYIHTLMVRMVHARVRRHLMGKGGWNTVPINQIELARTWLDFTYVPFSALQKVGFEFSLDELADLYAMWRVIADQLGVDRRFWQDVVDDRSAKHLLDRVDACMSEPSEDSRRLTKAMIRSSAVGLHLETGMPEELSVAWFDALCTFFHGPAMAAALGVGSNWTENLIPIATEANKRRWIAIQGDPSLKREEAAKTQQVLDEGSAQVHGLTTYEASIKDPDPRSSPALAF